MAVLRSGALVVALALASCYSPDLRDCTIACASQNDCAYGQVCGADQFCAAPEIAGRCSELPADAGSADRDAGVADGKLDARVDAAPVPPDSPLMVPLHLKIDGDGRAIVPGEEPCEKQGPQHGDCHYEIALGIPLTLTAEPYESSRFDRWNGMPCDQQDETCTFIPTAAADVHARFKKED
jgi:hypothetical protein